MGRFRKIWEFKLPGGATFPLAAELPEKGIDFLEMLKIEVGPEHRFRLLIDAPVTMWVHYVDQRTVPCFRDAAGHCEFCGESTSRRWMAYFVAWAERSKRKGIVGLTKGAYDSSPVLKGAKKGLAGAMLKAWRMGGHTRGKIKARLDLLDRQEIKPDELYQRHDLLAQLFWIMGVRVKEETAFDGPSRNGEVDGGANPGLQRPSGFGEESEVD